MNDHKDLKVVISNIQPLLENYCKKGIKEIKLVKSILETP